MFSFFDARRAKHIITVLTQCGIEHVRSVRKLKCGKVIICECRAALSTILHSQRCRVGHINTVYIFGAKISVTWVFDILCIKTHKTIFPVFYLITETVFTINCMHVSDELFFSERLEISEYFERASMAKCLTPELFKCFLCNRLIEYVIFFVFESIATDTVMTIITFFDAETVATIHWVFCIHTIITSSEVHPIIDEFTLVAKGRVNHVLYISDEVWIEHFLTIGCSDT